MWVAIEDTTSHHHQIKSRQEDIDKASRSRLRARKFPHKECKRIVDKCVSAELCDTTNRLAILTFSGMSRPYLL